jgi:asparagine synthase (glutamine-hydrolysing)
MCGIAGFMDRKRRRSDADSVEIARDMAGALFHRGPDDGGAWSDASAGIAFGFRRLSIIDLTPAGHQPMLSADGRYAIVFNGEIYNAEAIRKDLNDQGGAPSGGWRGHSDTEVLLQACAHFGVPGAVERLIGMFAFALWDKNARTLTLVRDRLGIKPLYWAEYDGQFLFGSELKALRAHPAFHAEIDRSGLAGYLRHAYVPSPRTIYRGAHKLPPAHMLTVTPDGPVTISRYWDLRAIARDGVRRSASTSQSPDSAAEELDHLLRDAVRKRMIADVPLGAFLSGGFDSSTVVALMQAQSAQPVKTFTIGFHEKVYDEATHARHVARHLGTEHIELYLKPDEALDLVPSIPEWFDEPFADASQLPTYLVSHLTRKHVTVALSGDGGDELFAGYYRHDWGTRFARVRGMLPGRLRAALASGIQALPPRQWDVLSRAIPSKMRPALFGQKIHKFAGLMGEPSDDGIYRTMVGYWHSAEEVLADAPAPEGEMWDDTLSRDIPDFTSRMQYLDMVGYMTDDILAKVDRASMAVSLEARVPLLDHRVVEHVWTLPPNFKLRDGTSKWLMRQVLYRYVPRDLVDRPKMGFAAPVDVWLRGPLREWAESLINEQRLRREGLFDPAPIQRKWTEHLSGTRDWQYDLWVVLMFQAWRERWMP